MELEQYNPNTPQDAPYFLKCFFELFYRDEYLNEIKSNDTDYYSDKDKDIFKQTKLKKGEHLDILVCGAGSGILEFSLLLYLLHHCKTANIIFIDRKKTTFKLLNAILQNCSQKENEEKKVMGKEEIIDEIINKYETCEDVELKKIYKIKTISNCEVFYSFFEENLEFNPNPENKNYNHKPFELRSNYKDFLSNFVDEFNNNKQNSPKINSNGFDIVIMSTLLQHISYWRSLISYTNMYLKDNGFHFISELGGDDFALSLDIYRGIIDSPLQKIFTKFIKEPFSIISDNNELSATNLEICEHFFNFFGAKTLCSKDFIIEKRDITKENLLSLFDPKKPVFSPYKRYYELFKENDIIKKIKQLDNTSINASFLLRWKFFRKIKEPRVDHFNVINNTTGMSIEDLQRYITETLDILDVNTTIFSSRFITDDDIKRREKIIEYTIELFARFILFKAYKIEIELLAFFINDMFVFPQVTINDIESQEKLLNGIKEYNKEIETKSLKMNEPLFNIYMDTFTKPFVFILDKNTANQYDDSSFKNNLHIVESSCNNNDNNFIKTKLGDKIQEKLDLKKEEIFESLAIFSEKVDFNKTFLIPCFRENFTNSSKIEKEFTAALFLYSKKDIPEKDMAEVLPFYVWLIKKFVDFSNIGNAIDFSKYKKRSREESIKSAITAIMSRNISHNLGSHVITNTRYQIENLSKKSDANVQKQLNGVTALLGYLQERQNFIAVIANNDQYPRGPLNFKAAVFDMLAMDGPAKRHAQNDSSNSDQQVHNYVLDNIVRSEEIYRNDDDDISSKGKFSIEIQMIKVCNNGENLIFKSNPKEATENSNSSNFIDIQLSVPYGLNGRHAFLVILENLIRNAAKHNKDDLKSDLVFSIIIKETDKNYEIIIADNKENYSKVITKFMLEDPNPSKDKSILDKAGKLKKLSILRKNATDEIDRENKGIKEILIVLSWLNNNYGKVEYHKIESEDSHNDKMLQIVGVDKDFKIYTDANNVPKYSSLGYKFSIAKYLEFYEVTSDEIAKLQTLQENNNDFSKELAKLTSALIYVFPTTTDSKLLKRVKKHLTRVVTANLIGKEKKQTVQIAYKNLLEESYHELPKLVVLEKKENLDGKNYQDCTAVERKSITIETDDSGMPKLDREHVLFYNHYDDRLKDDIQKEMMQIQNNCRFIEGISGVNFTQNLIRTSINEWDYLKIIEASLAKIAIVDERIFKKYNGSTPSERKNELLEVYKNQIETLINNYIQQIKDLLDSTKYDSIWKELCKEQSFLVAKQLTDTTINNLSQCKSNKEKVYHILVDYFYFTSSEMGNPEYNKFKDYLEHKNIYILNSDTNGVLITLDRKFLKNSEIKNIHFDFMSIHYGLFDKMCFDDCFEKKFNIIKTQNNISESTKIAIHSGRGGLSNIENKPFIPFSGINWSLDNCKYVLAELFYGIKY
jgi:hypothetical protein